MKFRDRKFSQPLKNFRPNCYNECEHTILLSYMTYRSEYLVAVVRASCRLCMKLAEKLKSSGEGQVKLLGAAFSCALCAIESAQSLYKDEQGKAERDKAMRNLSSTLKGWITSGDVIGGSIFGNSVPDYMYATRARSNWKGKQELKVCWHLHTLILY